MIPVTATAFVSGINSAVTTVQIEEVATGTVQSVTFQWDRPSPP